MNLSNACAPPNNFNPADSVCYAWNVVPSNGRYFADQDSTGKTVDIVFTEREYIQYMQIPISPLFCR